MSDSDEYSDNEYDATSVRNLVTENRKLKQALENADGEVDRAGAAYTEMETAHNVLEASILDYKARIAGLSARIKKQDEELVEQKKTHDNHEAALVKLQNANEALEAAAKSALDENAHFKSELQYERDQYGILARENRGISLQLTEEEKKNVDMQNKYTALFKQVEYIDVLEAELQDKREICGRMETEIHALRNNLASISMAPSPPMMVDNSAEGPKTAEPSVSVKQVQSLEESSNLEQLGSLEQLGDLEGSDGTPDDCPASPIEEHFVSASQAPRVINIPVPVEVPGPTVYVSDHHPVACFFQTDADFFRLIAVALSSFFPFGWFLNLRPKRTPPILLTLFGFAMHLIIYYCVLIMANEWVTDQQHKHILCSDDEHTYMHTLPSRRYRPTSSHSGISRVLGLFFLPENWLHRVDGFLYEYVIEGFGIEIDMRVPG